MPTPPRWPRRTYAPEQSSALRAALVEITKAAERLIDVDVDAAAPHR